MFDWECLVCQKVKASSDVILVKDKEPRVEKDLTDLRWEVLRIKYES